MSNVTDVLVALRTQLQSNLATSPSIKILHPSYDSGVAVTTALESVSTTPVIVLFQLTHREVVYDKQTFKRGGVKRWDISALIYFLKSASGPVNILSDMPLATAAMGKHDPWFDMMATALEADRTLGGTVLTTGDDDVLFRAMAGELPWNGVNYWGMQFLIPIKEMR